MRTEIDDLLRTVEQQTGYPVAVSSASISTHAMMSSASPQQPIHAIYVNPKYEKWGDYLVAMQCAMLLIKWADPERIPDFVIDDRAVGEQVQQISQKIKAAPLPAARQYAQMIVHGLLQQLNSIPMQMMAMEMCRKRCPSLSPQQQESVRSELRELSAVLDKRVRDMTPTEVYERSVAMNAAYTLHWADQSGDHMLIAPYQSLGFAQKGEELLEAYRELDATAKARYQLAVDKWAGLLDLSGWYNWSYRRAR